MSSLVSIIMPVYNVEKYIEKSIRSVLSQSYKSFELIIIIDGSPDKSGEIAEEFAKYDNRVKVYYKDNGGLSDARNYGMQHAKGKYIYFLDSDDYIEGNLLEVAINALEENDQDLIVFGFFADFEDIQQRVIKTTVTNPDKGVFSKENMDRFVIKENFYNYIGYAWNKLYKFSIIKENNIQFTKGLSLIEDIEFNYHVLNRINRIGFLDQALYHYMQRPRITLVNAKYKDFYELKLRAANLKLNLLQEWKFKDEFIINQRFILYMSVLDSTFRNISLNKELSLKLKRSEITRIINQYTTLKNSFCPNSISLKNKILSTLVRMQSVNGLLLFYELIYRSQKIRGKI
ncbi:glycosyltransferase family 2 protein [Ferdinandcohnia quinoae]|uniref:Glycosyltransferase n=1 Tax=Fredinandcohnia quinoae TaxID=2918902 RepID=A0AAW5DW65_9BACI|nr:glycosyltransferase family 2 protein [Fredinandcohnia sp. SECRCQ15]MCH1624887.1 glycosyltransferase [Fredinandcohnia sp. SECRCQ15]